MGTVSTQIRCSLQVTPAQPVAQRPTPNSIAKAVGPEACNLRHSSLRARHQELACAGCSCRDRANLWAPRSTEVRTGRFYGLDHQAPSELASARSPCLLAIGGLCYFSVVHRQGLPNDVTSCQKSIIRRHVWGVASEQALEAAAGPGQSPSFARFKLKHSFDPPIDRGKGCTLGYSGHLEHATTWRPALSPVLIFLSNLGPSAPQSKYYPQDAPSCLY